MHLLHNRELNNGWSCMPMANGVGCWATDRSPGHWRSWIVLWVARMTITSSTWSHEPIGAVQARKQMWRNSLGRYFRGSVPGMPPDAPHLPNNKHFLEY